MNLPSLLSSMMVALVLCAPAAAAASPPVAGLTPTGLRTEYLANPHGLDSTTPRLSWRVESTERGQRQTAYRILVAGDEGMLATGHGDLWDSGRIASDETLNIPYAGKPLASGQWCFWRVQVWDNRGVPSVWSQAGSWSMGLLEPKDWKAKWISQGDPSPLWADRKSLFLPPPRHFRKEFAAVKPVKRATLYASALGICEFHLNGRRIGDDYFAPGWSDYSKRAYYRAYDVTALVERGDNALGAIVADGWYAGYAGFALLCGYGPNRCGRSLYGKTPALLAQLEIEYADGAHETVATDTTWQVTRQGPIREADLIMGESYDARAEMPGWDRPLWRGEGWQDAILAAANGSVKADFYEPSGPRAVELGFQRPRQMQAYAAPPIRVTEEIKARRMTAPAPGVWIFDMGQNFAGLICLSVKGPAGTRVQIRYGEMLHPDGHLMTENLRRARATDFYTLRGDPQGETWTPRFTYHGFQFVELIGLPAKPALDAVTGLVLHNDTPLVGEFACSDPVLTHFARNACWTQRANFMEVPTDCPQRDERLGWMGDAQIYVRTASYFADVAAFYTKWADDVTEAQRPSGAYPDYCPYPTAHGKPGCTQATAWTDAGIICPWTMWLVYGDTRIIARHWDSMLRFMAWRHQADPRLKGVAVGNAWGDWLNVQETTPIQYIDLCYHALDARLMADMAGAIGRGDDAAKFRELSAALRSSFQRQYLKPDGALSVDTQSAYVLAMSVGLIPEELVTHSTKILAAKIAKNDYRMATGFLGTKPLLDVLTRGGEHELAVRLFQSRRFPSWGYEVVNGATSVWERWDSFTREYGFNGANGKQNAGMNSFNHYSFGAVMEWAYRDLAGIDTQGPGFRRLVLRPAPPLCTHPEARPIDWVTASYAHPRGRIVSDWRIGGGKFQWNVTIPANVTATAYVPSESAASVRESGQSLALAQGVKFLGMQGGWAVLELQSGRYHLTSELHPQAAAVNSN
jgi:alpha-L-rhamnosidase